MKTPGAAPQKGSPAGRELLDAVGTHVVPVVSKLGSRVFLRILPRVMEEQMIADVAQSLVCDAAAGQETFAGSPKAPTCLLFLHANSPLATARGWSMLEHLLPL